MGVVGSRPKCRRKERCESVLRASNQPKPASQKVASLSAKQGRSAATRQEGKMIYSSAVLVTSARNNDKRRRGQLRVDVALSQDDIQDCSRDR